MRWSGEQLGGWAALRHSPQVQHRDLLTEGALAAIRGRLPGLRLRGGVGAPHEGPMGLRASAAEARIALVAARSAGKPEGVATHDATGVQRMLMEWYASDTARASVRAQLAPLERLGPVGFSSGSPMYLGTEQVHSRDYAEATQRVIDEEVSELLKEAEKRALSLLGEHRDALDRLVADLLEHETVDGNAVQAALDGSSPTPGPAGSGGPLRTPQYQSRASDGAL